MLRQPLKPDQKRRQWACSLADGAKNDDSINKLV